MNHPSPGSGAGSGRHVREAKRALRERILRQRDLLPAADRLSAEAAIVTAIAARADFRSAGTVLLTVSFRSEWDTRPVFASALAAGKIVVAPRVHLPTRMLHPCAVTDLERDLAPGFQGISEPLAHCAAVPLAAIDWVLVPGVVFDDAGRRIGYGGGYYDRLLPLLRPDARRVAGAFELQVVEAIPAAPHDVTVDAIVTEQRTLEARRRG